MIRPKSTDRLALGAWESGADLPRASAEAFRGALANVGRPVTVVSQGGVAAVAEGGVARLGVTAKGSSLPLIGHVPALLPSQLGDAGFRAHYGVSAAYVAGEMANGIASEALVEAVTRAGFLGVFGAAGLTLSRVEQALVRLEKNLAGHTFGVNLIHSPDDQKLEAALVELFLARNVPFVSASAYLDLTLPVVRWRVTGIHQDASGAIVPRRLMAKVSRVEVAKKFLEPAPERFLAMLVAEGAITAEQAELARQVPLADDVTAEADSGGHTDNRPLVLLLPAIQALRDELAQARRYAVRPRVGAAGGLATPSSVASAFAMGAAYVVTGSVNQATREAGTSDVVRKLLAQAGPTDVAMAPAADMFELGVKVQVLTRGTMFAVRAQRLYELYRAHDGLAALPAGVREELESKYFRCSLEEAWAGCVEYFQRRDPAQLERAAKEPKHQLALLFRAYLGQASRWANDGVADRSLDFQVWCGPAMGAFNEWTKGSFLERWEERHAVTVAKNLMVGAAVLTRAAALRTQGVALPAEAERFLPKTETELEALVAVGAPVESQATESTTAAANADEPIAIVGMGALFPKAENLAAFWRLLRRGEDAVGDVPQTHWGLGEYYDADPKAPDKTYARRGAFLDATAFDPTEFGIPPAVLEATDTSQLLGLVVARMAMEDAGYGDGVSWDRNRASVILGVTGTQELVVSLGARLGHPKWRKALKDSGLDDVTTEDVVRRIGESYVGWQENSFPGLLGNVVAGRIANRLDFGGTNCVIDAACASSFAAVHLAVAELRSKRSNLVLTGGVDCLNDIFMHMCFSKTPALSASGDVRPFSDKADGTLLGEGLGMVVLKRLSDAERDGDRIYATIRGIGTSSDGRAKSIYAPLPRGQARALDAAYRDAGVRPRDIGLLEAHGTGTKAGDMAEVEALTTVYRQDSADPAWCALGSVKSQIGHTKAAAGAAGLIKASLALTHRVIPPTIKVEKPNPALKIEESPFAIATVARPWVKRSPAPRRAAVSAFGFGGSNFHVVLEEHGSARTAPAWDGSVELVALSAKDAEGLLALVKEAAQVKRAELQAFAARSREKFRSSDAHRLLAVADAGVELSALLKPALEKLAAAPQTAFSLPEGVHHGVGAAAGKLAFLFPGQGSQHVDMLRELSCVFPELLAAVERAPGVGEAVYPLPTFDAEEKRRREERLTKTDVAQPAIGAVSQGVLEALARFGVRPELVAGHSYGELVALHAAGALSAAELHAVSALRGSLMAGDGSDRGTMLAVLAPLGDIERMLTEEKLELVLANRNAPSQGVLSGAREEIARAEAACQKRGLKSAKLNVGAAFHSPLVAGAAEAFHAGLSSIAFGAPRLPVIADSTAAPYSADSESMRRLLAEQLARPVQFDAVIDRLYADGARTFVEVGPRATLTGLTKAILAGRSFGAFAVDAQSTRGGLVDFAQALCRIAAAGHAVTLAPWQAVAPAPRAELLPERKRKMSVPLTGANYRAPYTPMPVKPPLSLSSSKGAEHQTHLPAHPFTLSPSKGAEHQTHLPAHPFTLSPSKGAEPQAHPPAPAHLDSLRALQALQEQTARVHQTFLEGQLLAQQNFAALLSGGTVAVAPPAIAPALPVAQALPVVAAPMAPVVAKPVPAAPAPRATPAPVAAPAPAQPSVDVVPLMLEVVAEATGYPKETLELKMDLEADLGIDSIKRVEILSMLSRRVPGAPSVNPEKLGALKTLQQVADFVRAGVGAGHSAPFDSAQGERVVTAQGERAGNHPAAATVDVASTVLATVAELTGYPAETLTLGMEMEADLGIDSIKRVEILSLLSRRIPGAPAVNPEKLGNLRTLQQVIDFVRTGTPGLDSARPERSSASSATLPLAPSGVEGPATGAIDLTATVLSTVAELTGYPAETLTLDMEMEADLGIDSIKRVEILSLLSRRIPGAPSVNPEKLGDLRTLQQVIDFVSSGLNVNARSAPFDSAQGERHSVTTPAVDLTTTVLSTVAELTGYPAETLTLTMEMEADLGIDSIKRVEILSLLSRRVPGAPSVNPEKLGDLRTLQQIVDFVSGGARVEAKSAPSAQGERDVAPARPAVTLERRVVVPVRLDQSPTSRVALPAAPVLVTPDRSGLAQAIATALRAAGLEVISTLDVSALPARLGGVIILADDSPTWTAASEQALKRSLSLARDVAPKLRSTPNAFFVTLSCRDGAFGHASSSPKWNPLGGGLAGLSKTLAHEWPEVRCRALDVSAEWSADLAGRAIVEELTCDGPREVGLGPNGRTTLATRPQATHAVPGRLSKRDVVVVTGGARGVTAECARALAQATGISLVLLGRSPAPAPEPTWLTAAKDEAAIKRALLEHAPASERPSPRQLGDACRTVLAGREVKASLSALEALGVTAVYRSVDVRDPAAVRATLDEVRATLGPVKGLVHGAGVLRDKRIEDKRDDDFDQVLDTKLTGLRTLLEATSGDELTFLAFFASVTGRFGRKGQSDYAVANQALVSVAQAEAARRPHCRVVALDWGPWAGGMVTRALEAEFEREGVPLIPLAAGAQALVAEVQSAPGAWCEVMIGSGFGEETPAGLSLAVAHRLSAEWGVLADHRLAGKPVLPLAMTLEWFAQVAAKALPELTMLALEDVRVLKGVTLSSPHEDVSVWVGAPEKNGVGLKLPLELRGARDQVHVRAVARMGTPAVAPAPLEAPEALRPFAPSLEKVYAEQLFHGSRLEAIQSIDGVSDAGMTLTLKTHPTSELLVPGPRTAWATGPLTVDGVFQALIVWCRAHAGAPSLPSRLGALRVYRPMPRGPVSAVVRVREAESASVTSDVDLLDEKGQLVARFESYVCTVSRSLDRAFQPESAATSSAAPSA